MSKANVPNGVGPINSNYVMNLLVPKKSEYAFEEEQRKPSAVPSQYAVPGLENIVTVASNPSYQVEPLPANSRHLVPGAGNPVSGAVLKQKLAILEDKIYVPTILNGALYFVSADDDTRTAQESGSNTKTTIAPEEPTFTIGELTAILGQEIGNKLTNVKKAGKPLPAGLREALVNLKGNTNSSTNTAVTPTRSAEQLTTPHGSPWNTPTKNVDTAMSRTLLTATDTLSDKTAVSCTMLTGADTLSDYTAVSRTMLTGADTLSDKTAVSCTMLTGADTLSDHTAVSCTMLTGADTLSDYTAVSRTMLTGVDTLSDKTAVSCTMLTGADTLTSRTAASRTMLTGEEKSDEAITARSDTSLLTARSGSDADLATAVDSTTGIPLYTLLTTPITDDRAAAAVPSVDTMTALEAK